MAASVQALVQYWKNFDLPRLQKDLDLSATELANRQDESDGSRRRLVEQSRDFKKNTPEDIRKVVAPLLKSFQAEVDNLSKRSKAAEAAFLSVYKKIIEMPDPVTCLEHCLSLQSRAMRTQDLEIENHQLRETLNDYNQELRDVRHQEVTIKQLREQVRDYEDKLDTAIQAKTKEKESDLKRTFSDREQELKESHSVLSRKLEEAERKVTELQSALESTQSELFDLKSKYDEDSHAKSDEMDIIMNDLERANQRATLAEKEATNLKEQLSAAKHSLQLADQIQKAPDMEQAVDIVTRSSLEVELSAKEKEIAHLVEDIERLQSTLNTLKETSASKIAQLEGLVSEKEKIIGELGEKLMKQQDYTEIKKELGIMKSMEFGGSKPWEGEESHGGEGPPKPLEVLLLEKTKSLQSENTSLKVSKSELTGPTPPAPFPAALQNVDTFGSLLGEEIVSTYTKSIVPEDSSSGPTTPKNTEDVSSSSTETSATTATATTTTTSVTTTTSSSSSCKNSSEGSTSSITTPISTTISSTDMVTASTPEKPPLPPKISSIPHESASLEKLQEFLRHNIDRYANETLNTLNISRCVRELLSVHNIGQRLFAKFVLGLSQGTVSELLSKPKPWDKLTEKGRDSYRKMHAWASDEHCIYMLKALVPRRGKDSNLPAFKQDDLAAEERIAQILSDAQMAMMGCNKNSKSPLHNGTMGSSTDSPEEGRAEGLECGSIGERTMNHILSTVNSVTGGRRSRKYENDDIPQEMVARIYQEELAKLIGQRVEEGFRQPRDQYERTQEEIRQALTIYHQELSRLSQMMPPSSTAAAAASNAFAPFSSTASSMVNGTTFGPLPLTSGSGTQDVPVDATIRPKAESKSSSCCASEPDNIRHHGSAFSLVRPKTEPGTKSSPNYVHNSPSSSSSAPPTSSVLPIAADALPSSGSNSSGSGGSNGEDLTTSASPLQRMQSITNSLLSQSSVPVLPTPSQRPAKAVLPPITQQQFDLYNNLNTEDIVKQVKEQLSQYSISQRLFGESVLGLSQGSVSDLLARPKPWHMLTQKGREPFIRMKIFLEDDNAVHKLVASQYKIAPEKLMRTGGYAGVPINNPSTSKLPTRTPPEPNPSVSRLPPAGRQSTPNSSAFPAQTNPPRPTSSTPESLPIPLTVNSTNNNSNSTPPSNNNNRKSHPVSRSSIPYSQPSVYEMAALTTDMDTQSITSKIKENLLAHNIGQKIFGEVVLGLSQGSVSELLSKPKPWHMLSIKGREPFIRMQMWLNDPHNIEKLQTLKNERREANKRRRNTGDSLDSPRSHPDNHMYNFNFAPPSPYPPAKKPRVLFSEEQKEALRLAFSMDPYPSTATIEFLASELNLSVRTVTNWFHNHRMRMKQQNSPTNSDDQKSSDGINVMPPVREGATFDPVQYRILLNQCLADRSRDKGGPPSYGSGFYGGMAYMYSPYRNCSPLSDDVGTLDLSMSSQQHPSREGSIGLSKQDMTGGSSTDERSNSEMNDDSNLSLSQDQVVTEGSDRESLDEQRHVFSPHIQRHLQDQLRPTGSSSNRRKPAMPQWVDPGLELSPNSDVRSDDEDDDDDEDNGSGGGGEAEEIINGVCVRQTEDFDLMMSQREETVHVEPAPVPDIDRDDDDEEDMTSATDIEKDPSSNIAEEDTEVEKASEDAVDSRCEDMANGSDSQECSQNNNNSRKKNIRRMERSISEQEESWESLESKDRKKNIEKLQRRIETEEESEDWEF